MNARCLHVLVAAALTVKDRDRQCPLLPTVTSGIDRISVAPVAATSLLRCTAAYRQLSTTNTAATPFWWAVSARGWRRLLH